MDKTGETTHNNRNRDGTIMNKKGMTLIELLVYMAIAALLLAPVIMLMQNSSVNMARDAVTTDLRISGRDILNIMYEDIRNTGFKLIDATGAVHDSVTYRGANTSLLPGPNWLIDSSSFTSIDNGEFDALTIRKGILCPYEKNVLCNGADGKWLGYEIVTYEVISPKSLQRTVRRFIPSYDAEATSQPLPLPTPQDLVVAAPVEVLQFQYSDNMSRWVDGNDLFVGEIPPPTKIRKEDVRYIKISVVTIDPKKLAPVKTFSPIWIGNYHYGASTNGFDDQYLREVSEIVVPIPNNGLFPQ